jgi:hypothetical protein
MASGRVWLEGASGERLRSVVDPLTNEEWFVGQPGASFRISFAVDSCERRWDQLIIARVTLDGANSWNRKGLGRGSRGSVDGFRDGPRHRRSFEFAPCRSRDSADGAEGDALVGTVQLGLYTTKRVADTTKRVAGKGVPGHSGHSEPTQETFVAAHSNDQKFFMEPGLSAKPGALFPIPVKRSSSGRSTRVRDKLLFECTIHYDQAERLLMRGLLTHSTYADILRASSNYLPIDDDHGKTATVFHSRSCSFWASKVLGDA